MSAGLTVLLLGTMEKPYSVKKLDLDYFEEQI